MDRPVAVEFGMTSTREQAAPGTQTLWLCRARRGEAALRGLRLG